MLERIKLLLLIFNIKEDFLLFNHKLHNRGNVIKPCLEMLFLDFNSPYLILKIKNKKMFDLDFGLKQHKIIKYKIIVL